MIQLKWDWDLLELQRYSASIHYQIFIIATFNLFGNSYRRVPLSIAFLPAVKNASKLTTLPTGYK